MRRIFDPQAILRFGRRRDVAAASAVALAGFALYHLSGFALSQQWPPAPVGDAAIVFNHSRSIFAAADYPARLQLGNMNAVFPWPPSAVILLKALTITGPAIFMASWIGLMVGGLLAALRAPMLHERPEIASAWTLIAVFAVLIASSPVSWDLRNVNSNLIFLGVVCAGFMLGDRRPLIGGVLIAVSVSFKLYSGLLVLWLLVFGPRRAFHSALVALIVLWALLPMVCFGLDGAFRIYSGWWEQLRIVADPWIYQELADGSKTPIVTLRRAVIALSREAPDSSAIHLGVAMLWALWLATLAFYGWRSLRAGAVAVPSRAALADWVVLLLAPLPFSPWLEPYHAVPVLPGVGLCLVVVCDQRVDRRNRATVLAALAALALLVALRTPFAIRGLSLLAQFMVLTIALGALRPRLARTLDVP